MQTPCFYAARHDHRVRGFDVCNFRRSPCDETDLVVCCCHGRCKVQLEMLLVLQPTSDAAALGLVLATYMR